MSTDLLLNVKDAAVRYNQTPVFEELSFNIHANARIALIGKNGAGKSTLLKVVTGEKEIDAGLRWQEEKLRIGTVHQDIHPPGDQSIYDYIFEALDGEMREAQSYKVDKIAQALELDLESRLATASGGQLRRVGLARALVEEPDILLLDEPTNHMDLEGIQWLEGYVRQYNGAVVCISHDRTFLKNVSNQVFWLDRGRLRVCPQGFAHFDEWSQMLLEQEARELKNRSQIVAQEVEWASRGVKARRKRNERRVEEMRAMRDQLKRDQSAYRRATQQVKVAEFEDIDKSSKDVAEFYKVFKSYGDKKLIDGLSMRIQRGERIGLIGRNGSGKTTFLKLLMNIIEPDQGRVKKKKELEFSYFDQKRDDLNPTDSLKKALVPSGGDYINVAGKERHVCSYLKDFMFDPAAADEKVGTLSGGQKNRLMLAKILANPKTGLVLDEPTNDLDMETMDMLEGVLANYKGTLIIVSHDRDFLDQTISRILAFEGDGRIENHIGGYSDYIEHKSKLSPGKKREDIKAREAPVQKSQVSSKMSYKLKYELEQLPKKIADLEERIKTYNAALSNPDFYSEDPEAFHDMTRELGKAQQELERREMRWLELDAME